MRQLWRQRVVPPNVITQTVAYNQHMMLRSVMQTQEASK